MPTSRETFTIAASGTVSNGIGGVGLRLVGLLLPTLDSTTIEFEAAIDGINYVSIHTNTGATAAATIGNANTGGKFQAVPSDVGRISSTCPVRLKTAAQVSGAVAIKSVWERGA